MSGNSASAMVPEDYYGEDCPILYALDKIGQKWKLPILWQLGIQHGLHYNQLKRQVKGITNTMLTKSLRELEADGLIYRREYAVNPPAVEYGLTLTGKTLLPTLNDLYQWGAGQLRLQHRTEVMSHDHPVENAADRNRTDRGVGHLA